jgi:L-fuconate dehydratase
MDSARLAGVNEALIVMLMARKFNKPICMHAGGVGLCEMVIHLSVFDYIALSGENLNDRWCEYCDALHEHF